MRNYSTISSYSDVRVFIVRPTNGGVVTKADQKRLGQLLSWTKATHTVIHSPTKFRDEVIAKLKTVKLSKPMTVVEVPEVCWVNRHKLPETIPGTGVHATKSQLSNAFEIGVSK